MAFNPPAGKYKNVIFEGSTFPDDAYRLVPVHLNETIQKEYLPAIPEGLSKGLRTLLVAMTSVEGFVGGLKPSRSFRTRNPGNISNTDQGANKTFPTLSEGIQAQADFIKGIAEGKNKHYPLGKPVFLAPYYSPEIAANQKTYGIPPYLPGYRFTYTGQIDQFCKIYSTAARVSNSYVNYLTSFFHQNQIEITPSTTLAEIIDPSLGEIIGGI